MKSGLGPWAIEPKTAHYLLLLISFHYNISSRISRCGAYNFGHFESYLNDRIQIRIRQIFNVIVFPRHMNLLEMKPSNLVSVGIGPLCYGDDFVELGEPHESLTGDLYFIAKRMGIKYPLMPVATRQEIVIFTRFMANNKPTETNFKKLAMRYKRCGNGVTVFPKLPSMLKAYYKRWELNQQIKASETLLGQKVIMLLKNLWRSKTSVTDNCDQEQLVNDQTVPEGIEPQTLQFDAMEVEPESVNIQDDTNIVHVPPSQPPPQLEYIKAKYTMVSILSTTSNGVRWLEEKLV